MSKRFVNIDSLAEVSDLIDGFEARFIHSEHNTIAYWEVMKGAVLPEHNHPHEQISNVLDGRFELTIDGESRILEPGTVAIIPSNAVHSGRALTNCFIMDIFTPVREDYKGK